MKQLLSDFNEIEKSIFLIIVSFIFLNVLPLPHHLILLLGIINSRCYLTDSF